MRFLRSSLFGFLLFSVLPAHALPIEIVKVEQDAAATSKKGAAPGGKASALPQAVAISQGRVLNILIRNGTQSNAAATVRYWAIGRDMKGGKISAVDGGEKQVTLKPGAAETVVSEEFKNDYKQRSSFVATGTPKAQKGAKPAPNAAGGNDPEGTKMIGYGVQIIVEGKVMDERFSEGSYKKLVGGSDIGVPAPPYNKSASAPESK